MPLLPASSVIVIVQSAFEMARDQRPTRVQDVSAQSNEHHMSFASQCRSGHGSESSFTELSAWIDCFCLIPRV